MTWEVWVFVICSSISLACKIGIAVLTAMEQHDMVVSNREQRRHPNGYVHAQKFERVNQGIRVRSAGGGSHRKTRW